MFYKLRESQVSAVMKDVEWSRTPEEGRIAGSGPGEDRKATCKAHVCPRYTSQPPARSGAPTTGKTWCIYSTGILLHKAAALTFLIQLLMMFFISPISDCSIDNLPCFPQVAPSTTMPEPLYKNVTTIQIGLKQNQTTLLICVSSACFQ